MGFTYTRMASLELGLVVNSSNNADRLIEIKCPYSSRNNTIVSACSNASFFCTLKDNTPSLKKSHNYFYQIQGQMAVSGIQKCDFIVWTTQDFLVQQIAFDELFWQSKCLPALQTFYINSMLPEIVYPRYPQDPLNYSTIL